MSEDAVVELTWAGDQRTFRIGTAEWLALEAKRNSGLYEILNRLLYGTHRRDDIVETIRIALIGTGMDGAEAQRLVDQNVRPMQKAWFAGERLGEVEIGISVAKSILTVAVTGVPDDPVGKDGVAVTAPGTEDSPLPPFTETVQ